MYSTYTYDATLNLQNVKYRTQSQPNSPEGTSVGVVLSGAADWQHCDVGSANSGSSGCSVVWGLAMKWSENCGPHNRYVPGDRYASPTLGGMDHTYVRT